MANFLGLGNAWDHTFGNKGAGGWLFGKGPQALVPKDMQGLRQQNIDLLMSFMKQGAFEQGGAGRNFFFGVGPNSVDNFLSRESPEMATYNSMRPILEGMMTGTGPQFERDIAGANSQGGRFGSANAILRGEALRNLFNQRTQTANTLGSLAGQAGSSQFDRLFSQQNQMLQLISGLFGMSQSATNFPVENDKGAFGDIMKIGASYFGGRGGGGGSNAQRTSRMPAGQPVPWDWGNT
jgi:hypothetical protein